MATYIRFVVAGVVAVLLSACNCGEKEKPRSRAKSTGIASVASGGGFHSYKELNDAYWSKAPPIDRDRNAAVSAMVHAIREKEQNPRDPFGSLNPSGAIGFTQVMPKNIDGWSRECFGFGMTKEEFHGTPLAQILISHCWIGRLWDRYHDPRIVASCWFSGRTNYMSDGNDWIIRKNPDGTETKMPGTPIEKYVSDVLGNLSKIRPDLSDRLPNNPVENKKCQW